MIRFRSCSHYRSSLAACPVRVRAIALKGRGRPFGPRLICGSPRKWPLFLVQYWEGNAFGLLLILDDNYNLTTNNFTTEARSAQRTHRDFSAERSVSMLQLVILAGRWQQRRVAHRALVVLRHSWLAHVVRAALACCADFLAVSHARRSRHTRMVACRRGPPV